MAPPLAFEPCLRLQSTSSRYVAAACMSPFLEPPRSSAVSAPRRLRQGASLLCVLLALAASNDGSFDAAQGEIHGEGRGAFPLSLQRCGGTAPGEPGIWIRYCYEGGKLARDGRLLRLAPVDGSTVHVGRILDHLQRSGVDFCTFAPHAWDSQLGGWAPMTADTYVNLDHDGPKRVDVQMFRIHRDLSGATALPCPYGGNFTIGIVGCKAQSNLGTLWRGAYQMGADGVFVIGGRFQSKKKRNDEMLRVKQNRGHAMSGDTSVPLREYADWNEFSESLRQGPACSLVAVEMGGIALQEFSHPPNAIYLLGSEDTGIPESVLRACDFHVALPSVSTRLQRHINTQPSPSHLRLHPLPCSANPPCGCTRAKRCLCLHRPVL